MEKQIFRVEPFATYAEKRKAPISLVVAHGGLLYVSQMPPMIPSLGRWGDFRLPSKWRSSSSRWSNACKPRGPR